MDKDEIVCGICHEALVYDRPGKVWRTKYITEDDKITKKCYSRQLNRWDHIPKKNVGRLIKAAKRHNDKKRMGI